MPGAWRGSPCGQAFVPRQEDSGQPFQHGRLATGLVAHDGDLRDDHLLVHADVLARRAPDVRREGDELRREEGGDDGDEGRRQPKEGADDRDGAQLHDGDGPHQRERRQLRERLLVARELGHVHLGPHLERLEDLRERREREEGRRDDDGVEGEVGHVWLKSIIFLIKPIILSFIKSLSLLHETVRLYFARDFIEPIVAWWVINDYLCIDGFYQ